MPLCQFFQILTLHCQNLEKNKHHDAVGCLQAEVNQGDVSRHGGFAEPLLIGFECVSTTQEALVTDQGQAYRDRPPDPKIDNRWCQEHIQWRRAQWRTVFWWILLIVVLSRWTLCGQLCSDLSRSEQGFTMVVLPWWELMEHSLPRSTGMRYCSITLFH